MQQVTEKGGPERREMRTDETGKQRRILGIMGSRRTLGNCELFVKEVARQVPEKHELALLRLPELNIQPCSGCYRCIGEGRCWIADDIPFVVDQVAHADALIIASPVYFLGTHGSVKGLLDRAFSFFPAVEKRGRIPAILVTTYGMTDKIGCAPQALLTLAAFLDLEVKSSVSLKAALPGDVLLSTQHLKTASRLGKLLFATKTRSRPKGRACPFCGNEIVRMRKSDFICTLCHGSFTLDGTGRPQRGRPGWDVADIEFVREHRKWLMGMKARFMAQRKTLLARSLPYKEMGTWVKPE